VVEAADSLVRRFNDFATETKNLRVEADRQIAQGVDAVNGALERISELNDEISKANALGRPTGELEDERDRQLGTLSQWMDVSTFPRDNGTIVVMGRTSSGAGTTLVDSEAAQFTFDQANALGATADSGDHPELVNDPDTELGAVSGGKLGALFEMRDSTLTDFHRDIDRLAQSVRDRVNAAHNQGTAGNHGVEAIQGTVDVTSGGGDAIAVDTAGTITVNRVQADGTLLGRDTVTLPAGATTPAAIETAIDGLTGVQAQYVDGRLQITSDPAGDLITIDDGDITLTGNQTNGGEARSFSHYFGLNDLFVTGGVGDAPDTAGEIENAAGVIRVREDILDDPGMLSRGSTSSGPGVADGDNTTANALAAAFETGGDIGAAGKLPAITDVKLADYAGDLLSYYATSTQRTETARDFQETMRDELKFRADSESGVNVDEELSNMIVFEQAYNASARVISTVQQMFDTLDRMMN
jgi:flagellar hook-associated protein 1 FlgK